MGLHEGAKYQFVARTCHPPAHPGTAGSPGRPFPHMFDILVIFKKGPESQTCCQACSVRVGKIFLSRHLLPLLLTLLFPELYSEGEYGVPGLRPPLSTVFLCCVTYPSLLHLPSKAQQTGNNKLWFTNGKTGWPGADKHQAIYLPLNRTRERRHGD